MYLLIFIRGGDYIFKWTTNDITGNNLTDVNSITDFENAASEYWDDIDNLTINSKSTTTTISADNSNLETGKKVDTTITNTKTGANPAYAQRLVFMAQAMPIQEDKTEQIATPFDITIRVNKNLSPGQIQIVQQGHNSLNRVTKTTYYTLDPATGEKTIDTSKGDNGVTTTTTVLNEKQDEIIEVGPQTATIRYVHQNDDGTTSPITNTDGSSMVATVTGFPAVANKNLIVFDSDGNATANTIDYTNYQTDLANAEKQYPTVVSNDWQTAVDNGTNKYDLGDNFNRAAIIAGTATLPTTGPTYTIVLTKPEEQKGSLTVTFHDVTDNVDIPDVGYNSGEQDVNTPVNYNPQTDLTDLENKGYELADPSLPTIPSEIEHKNTKLAVYVKHKVAHVTFNHPYNQGDVLDTGITAPTGLTKSDLESPAIRTIHFVLPNGITVATLDANNNIVQTINFTRIANVDEVTKQITYSDWQTSDGKKSGEAMFPTVKLPSIPGYKAVLAPASNIQTLDLAQKLAVSPSKLGQLLLVSFVVTPKTQNSDSSVTNSANSTPDTDAAPSANTSNDAADPSTSNTDISESNALIIDTNEPSEANVPSAAQEIAVPSAPAYVSDIIPDDPETDSNINTNNIGAVKVTNDVPVTKLNLNTDKSNFVAKAPNALTSTNKHQNQSIIIIKSISTNKSSHVATPATIAPQKLNITRDAIITGKKQVASQINNQHKQLPQTGETDNAYSVLILGVTSLLNGLMLLGTQKRKKRD